MTGVSSGLEAIGVAVALRVPVLLWGGPGTGKSSAVRGLADAMDWPCEIVIASIREPSDFAGLPVVTNGEVCFAPPRWAQRLAAAGHGILFLDEISTAPPAVQAALLRVILDRVVGDLTLPRGVAVVAAGNPPQQAADGWELSAPLANRFCHIDWCPDAASFAEGLTTGWPAPRVPRVAPDWERRQSSAFGALAAFALLRPTLVFQPPKEAAAAGRAWPSHRSWEMAAQLLAAANEMGVSDEARAMLITGAVGLGAGIEFLHWITDMDLIDPEAALADPASFVLPDRGDRALAALCAVVAAVSSNPTVERWLSGCRLIVQGCRDKPDVAAVAARGLARCRPAGAKPPPDFKIFAPILTEAGLLM